MVKIRADDRALPDGHAAQEQARAEQIAALTRDQDADGLKDWEEGIFRTNPAVADTDADGTIDGDEIKQNRDPLTPNTSTDSEKPDDLAVTPAPLIVASDGSLSWTQNMTEEVSRSLLPDIVGPILSGKSPQSEDIAYKVSNFAFLQNPEQIWGGAKQYSAADIISSPRNDLASIAQMFLAITRAVSARMSVQQDAQSIIVNFVQDPRSENTQSAFLLYQQSMGGLIQDIRGVPIPPEYIGFILSYLNTLSKMHYSLALIANLENDPVSALIAIKALPQVQENFAAVVAKTQNESKKIVERRVKETANAQGKK